MTEASLHWALANPGPNILLLWLEPWAEEFEVPARSTIELRPRAAPDDHDWAEVEWNPDHLVVWASAPTVEVVIDGVLQDSCSAAIPVPEGLSKQMLNLLFADQPAARLGGTGGAPNARPSWWQRTKRRLGF